jgi:hypothetical protein
MYSANTKSKYGQEDQLGVNLNPNEAASARNTSNHGSHRAPSHSGQQSRSRNNPEQSYRSNANNNQASRSHRSNNIDVSEIPTQNNNDRSQRGARTY